MVDADIRKILVVRPDRIGDVVLSTPVVAEIKKIWPRSEVWFLVRRAVVPVVDLTSGVDGVLAWDDSVDRGLLAIRDLAAEVRAKSFDAAIVLQANSVVSAAIALAGVPLRVGPKSKWFSYLFFNGGVRQARSEVSLHEAQYNLELVQALAKRWGRGTSQELPAVAALCGLVGVQSSALARVQERLSKMGLAPSQNFVVVHAGMAGSALNWPEYHYRSLIEKLVAQGIPVVLGGGAADREVVGKLSTAANYVFETESSAEGLREYIALLSLAHVVVAPSTGPLHLAAAVGARTVSFYPPIRVQSAKRWGPLGTGHAVFSPKVNCPEVFKCRGSVCTEYDCMSRAIAVEPVFEAVQKALSEIRKS